MSVDWETRYQGEDTPWEKGEASPGLVDYLKEHPLHGRVLIPGCGLGHDVRAISVAGGDATEAIGVDIAPSAVGKAREFPRVGKEHFEQGNLFALPEEWTAAFDAVWEHTCFCAIDPTLRTAYAESIAKALKPGGTFLAVFYLDPGLAPDESGPPFGVTPGELDALFGKAFTLERDWTPRNTYRGREGRERMRLYRKR